MGQAVDQGDGAGSVGEDGVPVLCASTRILPRKQPNPGLATRVQTQGDARRKQKLWPDLQVPQESRPDPRRHQRADGKPGCRSRWATEQPGTVKPETLDEAVRRQRVADVDELSRRRVSATDGRRLLHEARSPARPTQPARRGQPLQPATVRARRSKLLPRRGPILERSGDLASRILADWDDSSAVAGTNVVYAATHHFGDPRRGIPARPFLGVSADARDAILQAIVDHLVR